MKVIVTSIFVDDQDNALEFYTNTLGFVKKHDVPQGEFRWLTVVSPEDPEGTEIVLEPNNHQAAKQYQERLRQDGIPVTMFGVDNIQQEYERLKGQGVKFTMDPTNAGPVTIAIFDDTCGNLIQIAQPNR
ncbi:VOC family protein [Niallia sp. Krafla_26]|uniref:VOC family protein n=1 Tax=Niallia sp. Krafla_26 TaxID=3064703 RepID=UPI003D17D1B4